MLKGHVGRKNNNMEVIQMLVLRLSCSLACQVGALVPHRTVCLFWCTIKEIVLCIKQSEATHDLSYRVFSRLKTRQREQIKKNVHEVKRLGLRHLISRVLGGKNAKIT